MTPLVWLVTGSSAGFGEAFVLQALARGDKVIATARDVAKLERVKARGADVVPLDVTSPLESLHKTAEEAVAIHGRVDVLVNNAGYVLFSTVEEATPEETQKIMDTNVFGLINVTRAFLPYMRKRRSGTIVNVSSIAALRTLPGSSLYSMTKCAVESMSEGLSEEVAPFGIRVFILEPGVFRTRFLSKESITYSTNRIEVYDKLNKDTRTFFSDLSGKQAGDPNKAVTRVIEAVTGTGMYADGREPELRIAVGRDCLAGGQAALEEKLRQVVARRDVAESTDHDDVAH